MPKTEHAELIRVRGLVQGVGFRPTVWRLADRHGLRGWVGNDGGGVTVSVCGRPASIEAFVQDLQRSPPPLARIDGIERCATAATADDRFRIAPSAPGEIRTGVVPDAAICAECRAEIRDPAARRYRYAFANCTHCGPRLSIIEAIPYDRAATTMRSFRMCEACAAEYGNPADRRFHAQPIACPACGPRVWLEPHAAGDAIEAARSLLLDRRIVAIKALGGFHLACDATNAAAVMRLRGAKQRDAKPFALMARDLSVIRRYVAVPDEAADVLQSPAAPIVLLDGLRPGLLPDVAPGLTSLGFMLPATPLHELLLQGVDRPLVMTSGNISDEPQCTSNAEAMERLRGIADHFLLHDRDIAHRVDDSVVRVMAGAARVLRRARGYAPAPLPLPPGFDSSTSLLAMGGELKAAFCLLGNGAAILSHHMGDLEDASTFSEYRRSIEQYRILFAHTPAAVAVDQHPDYLSTTLGIELAHRAKLPVIAVQHHHAHLAACLAENGVPLDAGPALGIVLDGLGWGEDGTVWGGEFLLGDYRGFRRLACLKPVAMPGGAQAIRQPWRNTLAHLLAVMDWREAVGTYGRTEVIRGLQEKPVDLIAASIVRKVNAPIASSCGRLFDAVAAAIGICTERASYEGQAAMLLEAAAGAAPVVCDPYPFRITEASRGLLHLDPAPLWRAVLDDVAVRLPAQVIAAKFHVGLAAGLARMVETLRMTAPIALSGGVFQNRLLLERLIRLLREQGHTVLVHRDVPANDGGLALGQAVIAAARTGKAQRS
ncbi:MAG: carbamoyltransferase HypF [Acetobacteraceae bacterium]|nr:carbamoyltransferase HypF [Acetobacteraceae bacterium]